MSPEEIKKNRCALCRSSVDGEGRCKDLTCRACPWVPKGPGTVEALTSPAEVEVQFKCNACGKTFMAVEPAPSEVNQDVSCPTCGPYDVERVYRPSGATEEKRMESTEEIKKSEETSAAWRALRARMEQLPGKDLVPSARLLLPENLHEAVRCYREAQRLVLKGWANRDATAPLAMLRPFLKLHKVTPESFPHEWNSIPDEPVPEPVEEPEPGNQWCSVQGCVRALNHAGSHVDGAGKVLRAPESPEEVEWARATHAALLERNAELVLRVAELEARAASCASCATGACRAHPMNASQYPERTTSATVACTCPCGACSGRVYGNREHSACRFGCADPRTSDATPVAKFKATPWAGVAEDGSVGFDCEHGEKRALVTFAADGEVEIVIRNPRTDYPTLRNAVIEECAARIEKGDPWEGNQTPGNAPTIDPGPLFALRDGIVETLRGMMTEVMPKRSAAPHHEPNEGSICGTCGLVFGTTYRCIHGSEHSWRAQTPRERALLHAAEVCSAREVDRGTLCGCAEALREVVEREAFGGGE